MLASVPGQSGLSRTVRGVRARLPAAMGEGVWDFFQLSDRLYLSLTDASYNSNTGLNLPVDDVVKLRVILEGELTFNFSKSKFRAGPGIYLSVHPGDHENCYDISRGDHLRMAVVHCGRDFFNDIIAEYGDKNSFNGEFLLGKKPIIRPLNSLFTGLILDLFTFPYSGRLGELYRDAKSIELFCHLLQLARMSASVRDQTPSVRNRAAIGAARQTILENLSNPPTIECLAREIGLNPTKLKFLFRDIVGMPIFEFMQNERLKLAKIFLQSTDFPISEVALRVGYAHPSNFTAAFKRKYGFTPNAIRKSLAPKR